MEKKLKKKQLIFFPIISYVHAKKLEKILFSIFLSIFPYDHGKDSTEIQFHADFPVISCDEQNIEKKILNEMVHPDNWCFGNNLPSGLQNGSHCTGKNSPIYYSFPHFYVADQF